MRADPGRKIRKYEISALWDERRVDVTLCKIHEVSAKNGKF